MIFAFLISQVLFNSNIFEELISGKSQVELILLVASLLIFTFIMWIYKLPIRILDHLNRLNNINTVWKFETESKNIKPDKHFDISKYKKEFLDRNSFEILKGKFVNEKKNLIITGRSGLGKTRSVFEILSKSKKKYIILTPKLNRDDFSDFNYSFKKRKDVVLFIDDLQKYNSDDINYYLENLIANSNEVRLIATCRTEHEEEIWNSMPISNLERYSLSEWTNNEGENLARILNEPFDSKQFDHTAGFILYKLEKTKERFFQLQDYQKKILQCTKLLKLLGLTCNSGRVREAVKAVFDFDPKYLTNDVWHAEINKLKTIGFFDRTQGEIIINDMYLNELIEINFTILFNRYFKFLKTSKNSGAIFFSGLYFESIKDFINAEKCFIEAILIFPDYSSAYYRLGSIYITKAKNEENILNLEGAKNFILTSIGYLKDSLKIKNNSFSNFLTLGYAYSVAASIYDKLKEKEKEIQNLNLSIDFENKAIELNSRSIGAYQTRGFSSFLLGSFDNAKSDFEKALTLNPFSHHIYFLLGTLYKNWSQEDYALVCYRKCIELKKDFYPAYNNIGHILAKKLQELNLYNPETIFLAKEAIKNYLLSIWYSRGKHFVAYSNLGHLYISLHKIDNDIINLYKTIKVQTIVINKSPKYAEPYASRAYALNKLHRFAESEKDLLIALELNPSSESIISNLAFCYTQFGQEEKNIGNTLNANLLFQKALLLNDKLIDCNDTETKLAALLGKGIILEKMGEIDGAYSILHKLFTDDVTNTKVLSTLIQHLKIRNNDEQISDFISILLKAVKGKKIKKINGKSMNEFTHFIQKLSRNNILSNSLQELIDLLKITFPDSYAIYKTSGIYYLFKGINEQKFDSKLFYYSKSENDFNKGKLIVPSNPVFLKYIGIVNSSFCLFFKETNNQLDYNIYFKRTNNIFLEAIRNFTEYRQLYFEYCKFLITNNKISEFKIVETKYYSILEEQKLIGKNNQYETSEELDELAELKSKFGKQ